MWRVVVGPLLFGLSVAACTRIAVEEQHAFDAKRTVSQSQLDRLGVERTRFFLPVSEELSLSAWWLRKEGSRGTVLYFGGNGYLMVNGYHILQGILQGPWDVLTVDYRGYGQSDGTPSIDALKSDALAVYAHLLESGVPAGQIVVHGQSLGSFVALWVATQRPVAGVVLETPVTNVEDLLGHLAPWWTRPFIGFDIAAPLAAEDNLERIAKLRRPALILAGENDKVAPSAMAEDLFKTAATKDKRLEIFPEGGHNDLPPRDDFARVYSSFLLRVFPSDRRPPIRTATTTPTGEENGVPLQDTKAMLRTP